MMTLSNYESGHILSYFTLREQSARKTNSYDLNRKIQLALMVENVLNPAPFRLDSIS